MARPIQKTPGQSYEEGSLELLTQLSIREAMINELKNELRGLQFDNDTKSAEAQAAIKVPVCPCGSQRWRVRRAKYW